MAERKAHPHKGHSLSAATRAKISKALKGRHHGHVATMHRHSIATRHRQPDVNHR